MCKSWKGSRAGPLPWEKSEHKTCSNHSLKATCREWLCRMTDSACPSGTRIQTSPVGRGIPAEGQEMPVEAFPVASPVCSCVTPCSHKGVPLLSPARWSTWSAGCSLTRWPSAPRRCSASSRRNRSRRSRRLRRSLQLQNSESPQRVQGCLLSQPPGRCIGTAGKGAQR